MKKNIVNFQSGYVALSSILVILVVILVIGISVTLVSISDAQNSLNTYQSQKSRMYVESCVDQALLELQANNNLPSNVVLTEGSCSVTLNSQTLNDWDFTVSGQFNGFTKNITVNATRNTQVTINSWKES